MTACDVLRQQFDLIYRTLALNLEGMTHEHSLQRPGSSVNNANWILAHLVQIQNGVMWLIGEKPVWTDERLPRVGPPPTLPDVQAFDWDRMKESLLASHGRCLAAIERLSDAALGEQIPDPFGGTTTRGALLGVLANHQPYHVGQLGLMRRLVGLPGAIVGPGQQPPAAKRGAI